MLSDRNQSESVWQCSYKPLCVQTALDAVAPGGRIVLVGLGAEKCCVPTMQTVFKEIDFMGSFRYTNTVSSTCSIISVLLSCIRQCPVTAVFQDAAFCEWCH